MKFQSLFYGENTKSIIGLSSADLAQRVVIVKCYDALQLSGAVHTSEGVTSVYT